MQEVLKSDYIIYTDQGPFLYMEYPGTKWPKIKILTINYRGVYLHPETLANPLIDFRRLQEYGYKIVEIHCLSSVTKGQHDEPGTPSGEHGQYIWTRAIIKAKDVIYLGDKKGKEGPWVYVGDGVTPDAAARDCALTVLTNLCLRRRHDLRTAVLEYDVFKR